jgi:hypothetical protein
MSDTAVLERGYRRWLRCYPRAFRREHEGEMLTVLIAGAGNTQRRPRAAECIDLLTGAIAVRVRPRVPRTNRSVLAVVKLMYVGATLELATAVMLLATVGELRSNIVARDPGFTAAGWQAVVTGQIDPLAISAGIATVFLLWLAWAFGQGKRWPGVAFAVFFAATTWSILGGVSRGSFVYAPADLAIASVLWLVELAVLVLIAQQTRRTIAIGRTRRVRAGVG